MEKLEKVDFGLIERLFNFSELLPQTKLKIILLFSFTVLFSVIFFFVFTKEFKKKKLFASISLVIFLVGSLYTYTQYPTNNLEQIYPNYSEDKDEKIVTNGTRTFLERPERTYLIEEGRLSIVEER